MPNRYTWVLLATLVVVCVVLVWADFTRDSASFSPRIISPESARGTADARATRSPTAPGETTTRSPSVAGPTRTHRPARPSASPTRTAAPTRTAPAGTPHPSAGAIELASTSYVAEPFETLHIDGTYDGPPSGTRLRVQQQRPATGRWMTFPLPTTTDAQGRFTAYVELGGVGRYLLRVVDPQRDVASPIVTVEIE